MKLFHQFCKSKQKQLQDRNLCKTRKYTKNGQINFKYGSSCIISTVLKFLINLMKILHRPHSRAQTLNDDDTIHLSAARFAKPAETFEKFHKFEGGGLRYTFI